MAERRVVIVTGASSGIGEALVREYIQRGARVVLAARSTERMASIVASVREGGGEAIYIVCDVTKHSDCQHLIEATIREFGRIDTLICSAGISMRAPLLQVNLDVLHRVMDVNFFGVVNCVKYALTHLIASGGSVVGISSLAGLHGLPQRTGYSASKYALTGFLDSLRIELKGRGVHVMVACPGYTASRIRYSALLADGSPQGSSPRDEKGMMSAERVAQIIADDVTKRRRMSLVGFTGHAVALLKRLYPPILDTLFAKAIKSEV